MKNWAGNYTYRFRRLLEPRSLDELREQVRAAHRLRVLGTRHAFNDILDTDGDLLTFARLPRRFEIDLEARTVTVDGGARYGELCRRLHEQGLALPNLPSLPHVSVAGACATATHGSGDRLGVLSSSVRSVDLVRADGELVHVDREGDPDLFPAAAVHLGGLGVVVALTLDAEPAYRMRQDVFEDMPIAAWLDAFDEVAGSGVSVSFFTDWSGPVFDQVWLKRRVGPGGPASDIPGPLARIRRARRKRHPIRGEDPAACTPQLGREGPWHERLPHFRLGYTPSSGEELQSEYLVPREHAQAALVALERLRRDIARAVQVSEIRTVARDDLWLSPAGGRPSAAIHFTWRNDWPAVRELLPRLEAALDPFDPRPHWGKLFAMRPEAVRARYAHRGRFVRAAAMLDPGGTFANDYLRRFVLDP